MTSISRRNFLRGTAAVGLSTWAGGLAGCRAGDYPELLLNGEELLGRVTSTGARIRLVGGARCQPSTAFKVVYDVVSHAGPSGYASETSTRSGFAEHDPITFDLSSLEPASRYHYRLAHEDGGGWVYGPERTIQTRRAPGESFRICFVGDSHVVPYSVPAAGLINGMTANTYGNAGADGPDLLFPMGDDCFLAYQGAKLRVFTYPWSGLDQIRETWQRTRRHFDLAGHSAMTIPITGNHEGLYGWTTGWPEQLDILDARSRYLPLADEGIFLPGGDPIGRYGALEWGAALIVWLDCMSFLPVDPFIGAGGGGGDPADWTLGPEQRAFLASVLGGSSAPIKIVLCHHLLGGDPSWAGYGRGNANDAHAYEQAEIQALLEEHGVQAFVYGHDHAYSVSTAGGVAYVCAGQPGSECPWVEELESTYSPYEDFTTVNGAVPAGHTRLDVTPGSDLTFSYVRSSLGADNGTVLSSYTVPL